MIIKCAVVVLFFSEILSAREIFDITDENYKKLPPIYHIDPHPECLQQRHKMYCTMNLRLYPLENRGNGSEIWRFIEATRHSKRHYNHDELYHAICTDDPNLRGADKVQTTAVNLEEHFSKIFSEKYENLGIKTEATEVDCKDYQNMYGETKLIDQVALIVFASYLLLNVASTIYDLTNPHKPNKYLVAMSVRNSFREVQRAHEKVKMQKLKCIQGIRFYTTLLILFFHTFGSFTGAYVKDTKYFEDIPLNPFRHALRNWFVYLVQTYFLISAWLLSYQTFQMINKKPEFRPFRFVTLTFLNRYLRIVPPVIVMILIGTSKWVFMTFKNPLKHLYSHQEYVRCCRNWWRVLASVNNIYSKETCYFITWYLSADTQLYLVSLVILALAWKFPNRTGLFMGSGAIFGICVTCVSTYIYDLDFMYRMYPENAKYDKFLSFEFAATYMSTFPNMASYMIGLMFGYIYFKTQNKTKIYEKMMAVRIWWWILFIGPLLVTIYLSSYEFDRVTTAILSGTLRPLYGLGIAVGILGMSHQIGGIAKKFCEWKPALVLGNFTYCTYIAHYLVIFSRTCSLTEVLEVSDWILLSSFVKDAIASFAAGFVMHILVEIPMAQLQSYLIPKPTRSTVVLQKNGRKKS